MKNKKSLFAIIAIVLIAVVGVTIAYFQSTAAFENLFNVGIYKVVTTEVFESPDNWAPGQEIPKTITTTNEGTIPAAVRVSYTEQWLDSENVDITSQVDAGTAIINFDNTGDWIQDGNNYYYKYILKPGNTTSSFIRSVTLNPNINGVACTTSQNGLTKTCESANPTLGATYKLTITKETVQADRYQDVWNTNISITEKILPIGTSVNYSTSLNGVTLDSWKVFYNEGDYTYIILSDYLPNSAVNISNLIYPFQYGFVERGCRNNLLAAMSTKSNWDELLTNGSINNVPLNLTRTNDVWAIGSPTIELWLDSWNSNTNYPTIYAKYENPASGITNDGYYVGFEENPSSYHINVQIDDELYFPQRPEMNVSKYWINSPSAASYGNQFSCALITVYDYKAVSSDLGYDQVAGFRPVIRLPISVLN